MNVSESISLTTEFTNPANRTLGFHRQPFIVAFNLILGLFVASTNGMVILAYILRKGVRKRISQFLINLAVADFLSGCVGMPLNAFFGRDPLMMEKYDISAGACVVVLMCPILLSITAVLSIVMVAIDRLVSILRPFHYTNIVTRGRSLLAILTAWIFAFLYSLSPTIFARAMNEPVQLNCAGNYVYGSAYSYTFVFAIMLPAIVIVTVIYLIIYRVANRHFKELQKLVIISNPSPEQKKLTSNSKAAKTAFVITTLFVVSWVPFLTLIQLLTLWNVQSIDLDENASSVILKCVPVTATMAYIISAVNPVIYCLRDPLLKFHVRKLLTCGRYTPATVSPMSCDLDGNSSMATVQSKRHELPVVTT